MRKFTMLCLSVAAAIGFSIQAQGLNVAGSYSLDKIWRGTQADPYSYNPRISYTGTKNEIKLTGIPKYTSGVFNPTVYGKVDPAKREIKFFSGYMYTDQRYGDVWVQFYDMGNAEAKVDDIVATVEADGTILFPHNAEMQFEVPSRGDNGILWAAYGISLTPIPDNTFSFNPSEWLKCGDAIFADNALTSFGEMEEDDWDTFCVRCPLYKHRTIEGDYLLLDPYGQDEEMLLGDGGWNSWVGTMEDFIYQILALFGMQPYVENPGFIRFNVADPDCIFIYPYVYTGVKVDWYSPGEYDDFYLYNLEGRLIATENKRPQDVIRQFSGQGRDVSYYDYGDKCAYFYNLYIGTQLEPLGDISYYGDAEGISTQVRVRFDIDREPDFEEPDDPSDPPAVDPDDPSNPDDPADPDDPTDPDDPADPDDQREDGVAAVDADFNAPVKYLTLQGVEVANPAKGSILIRKAGNSVRKVIVK